MKNKSVKLPFVTKKENYLAIFASSKNKTIVTCTYYCKFFKSKYCRIVVSSKTFPKN